MIWKSFSNKQLTVLNWWCRSSPHYSKDAIICDGAVRSGKTTCMSLSFVLWAFYEFDKQYFAICGKTISSLKRNLIAPLIPMLNSLSFSCEYKASKNILTVRKKDRVNYFYLFGGKDESSSALIQGITLAGILLDEVVLMPRSFAEQAIARCSVSGSRFWFNCNPDNPSHWFYNEWIKKRDAKNALYVHFTMDDNPSLTPAIKKRYEALYSGVFYDRFVKGRWTVSSGLVYPMFSPEKHIFHDEPPCDKFYISCDYGTVNPASFGLWGRSGDTWYRLAEYYYDSRREGEQKTDEEYYEALKALSGNRKIEAVVCDPSAASFMAVIRRHGLFSVLPADNNVADGIRKVSSALKAGKIKFSAACRDTLREFSLYRWQNDSVKDAVRKENDHAMDDIRYFVATVVDSEEDVFFAAALNRNL